MYPDALMLRFTGKRIRRQDMFREIFTARDARRKESTTRLPFASFYTNVAVTRHENRPGSLRSVSGLEIGKSSNDFRIYYRTVVRFDYEEAGDLSAYTVFNRDLLLIRYVCTSLESQANHFT